MKHLFAVLAVLSSLLSPNTSHAIHVVSQGAGIDITTDKVSHILGPIIPHSTFIYQLERKFTGWIPGPRVVVIDSPGGMVDEGNVITDMLEQEKAMGTRMICVVVGAAHSMAFNILSHCDVRLATPESAMVFHKIAVQPSPYMRLTSKTMKKICEELDAMDKIYNLYNSKALHMTLKEYDDFADAETQWSAGDLLKRKYLQGLVDIAIE